MGTPIIQRLTQSLTRWPRSGDTFGSGELFAPSTPQGGIRWTPVKVNRIANEAERASAGTITAVVQSPIAVADLVAFGDQSGLTPYNATGVYEVKEYRETQGLLDTRTVRRIVAAPLNAQLFQSVTVWAIEKTLQGRSYVTARAATPAYTGPASVDILSAARAIKYSSAVLEYTATVTVPRSAALAMGARYEIEWNGFILEAIGPVFNNGQSPLIMTFACTMEQAGT